MSNSRTRALHCWYASASVRGAAPTTSHASPVFVVCGCMLLCGVVLRGCLQALKHLDGLEVDGSTMMVKVPSATSKRLEEYKAALDERHKQQLEEAKRQAQTRAAVAAVQKLQGGSAPVDEPGEVPEKVLAPFEQEEVACTSAIDEALSAFTVRKKEEAEQARLDAEFEAADRALIGEESKGRGGDISDPNRGKHILTEIEKFRLQEVCGCGYGCGYVCVGLCIWLCRFVGNAVTHMMRHGVACWCVVVAPETTRARPGAEEGRGEGAAAGGGTHHRERQRRGPARGRSC